MRGTNFTYNNKQWGVGFGVTLPNAKTESEALEQGKAFLREKIILNDPIADQQINFLACDYTKSKNFEYIVSAYNPPAANDSSLVTHFKNS